MLGSYLATVITIIIFVLTILTFCQAETFIQLYTIKFAKTTLKIQEVKSQKLLDYRLANKKLAIAKELLVKVL